MEFAPVTFMANSTIPGPLNSRNDPQDLIQTWKNVAHYLGISEREAQYRAKEEAMPIHREPGIKGRVYASRTELDAWLKDRLTAAKADKVGPQAVDDTAGKAASGARRIWLWALLISATACIVAGSEFATHWSRRFDRTPASLEVKSRNLIVRNASGYELWRQFFPESPDDSYFSAPLLNLRSYIGDLFSDARLAVLFIGPTTDQLRYPNRLHCYDGAGRQVWDFTPTRSIRNVGGAVAAPPFTSEQVHVFGRGRNARIALSSVHHSIDPSSVTLLGTDGSVQAEYWHPGQIRHLSQIDMDGHGENMLLAGGVNNGEQTATIVVLDPYRLPRLSTPARVTDERFRLLDIPPANERAVILFPRSCVSKGSPYTRVVSLRATSTGFTAVVAESFDPFSPQVIVYDFDRHLRVASIQPTPEYVEKHRAMQRAGEIGHAYDEAKEIADLKSRVVVRWGSN